MWWVTKIELKCRFITSASYMTVQRSKMPDTQQPIGLFWWNVWLWYSPLCFFQFERFSPSNHMCTDETQACLWPEVDKRSSRPSENGTNQIQERPHPLHPSWYFGMVYLSQEKTITYYPEGYSFLLFVGVGEGREWLNNHFVHRGSYHTASFPSPIKLFSIKSKINLSSFHQLITAWSAAGRWFDARKKPQERSEVTGFPLQVGFFSSVYTTQNNLLPTQAVRNDTCYKAIHGKKHGWCTDWENS